MESHAQPNPMETQNRIAALVYGCIEDRPDLIAEVLRRQALERPAREHPAPRDLDAQDNQPHCCHQQHNLKDSQHMKHIPKPSTAHAGTNRSHTHNNTRAIDKTCGDGVEDQAGARLIALAALAPEMLEALKALPLQHFDKDPSTIDAAEFVDYSADFMRAIKLARTVIAKVV